MLKLHASTCIMFELNAESFNLSHPRKSDSSSPLFIANQYELTFLIYKLGYSSRLFFTTLFSSVILFGLFYRISPYSQSRKFYPVLMILLNNFCSMPTKAFQK